MLGARNHEHFLTLHALNKRKAAPKIFLSLGLTSCPFSATVEVPTKQSGLHKSIPFANLVDICDANKVSKQLMCRCTWLAVHPDQEHFWLQGWVFGFPECFDML